MGSVVPFDSATLAVADGMTPIAVIMLVLGILFVSGRLFSNISTTGILRPDDCKTTVQIFGAEVKVLTPYSRVYRSYNSILRLHWSCDWQYVVSSEHVFTSSRPNINDSRLSSTSFARTGRLASRF